MSKQTDSEETEKEKKEYGKISLNLILTKDQINACSGAVLDCKSLQETAKKVSSVLLKNEEAILDKGYEPEQLSYAIAQSLYPAMEKLRKEGKLD